MLLLRHLERWGRKPTSGGGKPTADLYDTGGKEARSGAYGLFLKAKDVS